MTAAGGDVVRAGGAGERQSAFERELESILEYHIERFYSKQVRARAEAGPGLFGQGGFLKGGKGTDYWTLDYAKENIDFCLYDVAVAALQYKTDIGTGWPEAERRLAARLGELNIGKEVHRYNEFGLRPPPEVIDRVAAHADQRLAAMLGALNRGLIDPRLQAVAEQPVPSGKWLLGGLLLVLLLLAFLV